MSRNSNENQFFYLTYTKSRKAARDAVGLLNDEGIKRTLNEDKDTAEKLNKLFASVFSTEAVWQMSMAELTSGMKSDELSQVKVARNKVLELQFSDCGSRTHQ